MVWKPRKTGRATKEESVGTAMETLGRTKEKEPRGLHDPGGPKTKVEEK